jgi:tRNA(Ile)-lysidine synthase
MQEKLNINIISRESVALAISGGPDSMAMLYMMHEQGIKFTALTVNHNLRPEALEEAEYVASICTKLGIQHVILLWKHDGITSNIHDQARDARYSLMTDWCNARNIKTLCTAHHMDDRLEHFFIRISRGAGLLGLIDHEEILYNGVTIVRPMFGFTKNELLDYLYKKNIKYFEDKSNSDPKYLRSNIRKWLNSMPEELDPELFRRRVIGVKENLARASEVIQRIFEEEMRQLIWNDTTVTVHSLPQDEEIAIMMLSHILPIISDQKDPPRMESMKRLYDKLSQNNTSKTTLCGCIIEKKKDRILVSRELRK